MDFSDYLRELADGSVRLQVANLARLSGMPEEARPEFAEAWPRIDVRRRRRIVQELVELAEDNVELDFDAVFTRGLSDEDADVRLESVRGLWEHEGPDIIEPLLEMLEHDEDAGVRAEAALALGRFVGLAAEGKLRERYAGPIEEGLRRAIRNQGEVEEVRARALEAAGAHDGAWVRQAISEAYESDVMRLKASAVHAMGRSCEDRWLPLLVKELGSDEAELRYEAAIACGGLADERAIPHLIRLIVDPDEEVKEAAIHSLGEIGGRQAREALLALLDSESEAVRDAATEALAQLDFEEDPLSFRYRF
jgi:HEAT repeat protein